METPERPKQINYWLVPVLGMALFSVVFAICWRAIWYSGTHAGMFSELCTNPLWFVSGGTDCARYLYPGPLFIASVVVIPTCAATTIIAIGAKHFKTLIIPNTKALETSDVDHRRLNVSGSGIKLGENPVEREEGKD